MMFANLKKAIEEYYRSTSPKPEPGEPAAVIRTEQGLELTIDSEGSKTLDLKNKNFPIAEIKNSITELYVKSVVDTVKLGGHPLQYVFLPHGVTHIRANETSLKEISIPLTTQTIHCHNQMYIRNLNDMLKYNPKLVVEMGGEDTDNFSFIDVDDFNTTLLY